MITCIFHSDRVNQLTNANNKNAISSLNENYPFIPILSYSFIYKHNIFITYHRNALLYAPHVHASDSKCNNITYAHTFTFCIVRIEEASEREGVCVCV